MKRHLITTLALIMAYVTCYAQRPYQHISAETGIKHAPYSNSEQPEYVLLNHDKMQGCFQGDTINVDILIEPSPTLGNNPVSGVVYVDLLSPEGEMVDRAKLRAVNGRARGKVALMPMLGSGLYELRAYTRYMMNWVNARYYSTIIPVYEDEDTIIVRDADGLPIRHIDMKRHANRHDNSLGRYHAGWTAANPPIQIQETKQVVMGHLQPKPKSLSRVIRRGGTIRTGNRPLTRLTTLQADDIMLYLTDGSDKVLTAKLNVDASGQFACYLPDDISGDWGMAIMAGDASRYRSLHMSIDCLFAPRVRDYDESELTFPYCHIVRPTTKPHKTYYYDCDSRVVSWRNGNMLPRDFLDWLLHTGNPLQTKGIVTSPQVLNSRRDSTTNRSLDVNLVGTSSDDRTTVCFDGPNYNGRPVVWIVDGAYRLITGLRPVITDFTVKRPTTASLPFFVDEARSVFITEDPQAYQPYMECSVLAQQRPVTVFIRLNSHAIIDDSALYSGHFVGYGK